MVSRRVARGPGRRRRRSSWRPARACLPGGGPPPVEAGGRRRRSRAVPRSCWSAAGSLAVRAGGGDGSAGAPLAAACRVAGRRWPGGRAVSTRGRRSCPLAGGDPPGPGRPPRGHCLPPAATPLLISGKSGYYSPVLPPLSRDQRQGGAHPGRGRRSRRSGRTAHKDAAEGSTTPADTTAERRSVGPWSAVRRVCVCRPRVRSGGRCRARCRALGGGGISAPMSVYSRALRQDGRRGRGNRIFGHDSRTSQKRRTRAEWSVPVVDTPECGTDFLSQGSEGCVRPYCATWREVA